MQKFVVLSHTHWDREWYMPFEQFRMRLVDLIDRLLGILRVDGGYIFHLDAQTVVLEDYLEIHPEREDELKKYIAAGNIVVGPWYLQNDFFLTSGEATVRNLLRGMALAEKFGKCTRVAYAPDQFGNISQLPQIFNGFGMDTFMFGRGYSFYEEKDGEFVRKKMPAEFVWEGEDGSRCLAVHLYQWYNNAQHIPEEPENAQLLLDINAKIFGEINLSPYVVLMNGVDHLEPQDNVRGIIDGLRGSGCEIAQYRMDEYFDALKKWFAESGAIPQTYTGALDRGRDDEVLRGCWSSRIPIKQENVRAQTMLEDVMEPLYSYLDAMGMKGFYPGDYFAYLWKRLLRNHPHDSICCCSRDEVAAHMEDSYARFFECADELLDRGMKQLLRHSRTEGGEYVLTVFNPTERAFTGVVETNIRFLQKDCVHAFCITNEEGKPCETEIVEFAEELYDVFSGLNLPGVLNCDRYKIRFAVRELPAFSARSYTVTPCELFEDDEQRNVALENEYYCIGWENGNLWLDCKETGRHIENLLRFEDTGDRGDLYIYEPADETAIYDEKRTFRVVENTELKKSIRLSAVLCVPNKYEFERSMRGAETVNIPVSCTVSFMKGSRTLTIEYEIENRAEDHRVRLLIDGAAETDCMTVDSPFDCRVVRPSDACPLAMSRTFCNTSFAAKHGEGGGFALFTEGQHEAESVGTGIALTCLRSSGSISRTAGSQWQAPGGQCKQKIEGKIGFYAFSSATDADLFACAKQFRTGIPVCFDGSDPHKFSGGRFAVQDAKLAKFYYEKDPYEGISLRRGALFELGSDVVTVSAVKRSEQGDGIIVRLVNYSSLPVDCAFNCRGKVFDCGLDEKGNGLLGRGKVVLHFRPKEIKTVKIL